MNRDYWQTMVEQLALSGATGALAKEADFEKTAVLDDGQMGVFLKLPFGHRILATPVVIDRLAKAVSDYLSKDVVIVCAVGKEPKRVRTFTLPPHQVTQ